MAVSLSDIKKLKALTGEGLSKCKEILISTGSIEKAIELINKNRNVDILEIQKQTNKSYTECLKALNECGSAKKAIEKFISNKIFLNNITKEDIYSLAYEKNLVDLSIHHSIISESFLHEIGKISTLNRLEIIDTKFEEKSGLSHLNKLTKLETLVLISTNIDDNDLYLISLIPNIKHLEIIKANITNACLIHLKAFSKLKYLELSDLQIDFEHIDLLSQLKFNYLELWDSFVEEEVLNKLKKILPESIINLGEWSNDGHWK